jgi:hypothetical protein
MDYYMPCFDMLFVLSTSYGKYSFFLPIWVMIIWQPIVFFSLLADRNTIQNVKCSSSFRRPPRGMNWWSYRSTPKRDMCWLICIWGFCCEMHLCWLISFPRLLTEIQTVKCSSSFRRPPRGMNWWSYRSTTKRDLCWLICIWEFCYEMHL